MVICDLTLSYTNFMSFAQKISNISEREKGGRCITNDST